MDVKKKVYWKASCCCSELQSAKINGKRFWGPLLTAFLLPVDHLHPPTHQQPYFLIAWAVSLLWHLLVLLLPLLCHPQQTRLLTNLCEIKWNLNDYNHSRRRPPVSRLLGAAPPRHVLTNCIGVSDVQVMENTGSADVDRKVELHQMSVF